MQMPYYCWVSPHSKQNAEKSEMLQTWFDRFVKVSAGQLGNCSSTFYGRHSWYSIEHLDIIIWAHIYVNHFQQKIFYFARPWETDMQCFIPKILITAQFYQKLSIVLFLVAIISFQLVTFRSVGCRSDWGAWVAWPMRRMCVSIDPPFSLHITPHIYCM